MRVDNRPTELAYRSSQRQVHAGAPPFTRNGQTQSSAGVRRPTASLFPGDGLAETA